MARALSVLSSAPLLVVSPHFDDGALSCGALFDREEPVDLLTVFSGGPEQVMHTSWDRACGFADSTEAMRHRQEEERRAFAPEGHRLHELDLIDAQYDGPRGDAEASALTGWLETWVAATSGDGWWRCPPVRDGRLMALPAASASVLRDCSAALPAGVECRRRGSLAPGCSKRGLGSRPTEITYGCVTLAYLCLRVASTFESSYTKNSPTT